MNKFFLLLLMIFICSDAFGATQLKKTVCPSGCDYTSLEAATNGNEQNLVTEDKYFDVEISGDWSGGADTTRLLLNNFTTDETHYIHIYTSGLARHNGVYSSSYYVLDSTSNDIFYFGWVYVDGLQFNDSVNLQPSTGDLVVTNTIFNLGTVVAGSGTVKVINSILMSDYMDHNSTTNALYIYNSTSVACRIIMRADTINYMKNFLTNNGDAFLVYTGATFDLNYSALKENKSTDWTSGGNNRVNQTFTFVDSANGNYHLASTDAGARDYGDSDISALGYTYSTDIDGQTRSGTWDIGADEFVSGGAPAKSAYLLNGFHGTGVFN